LHSNSIEVIDSIAKDINVLLSLLVDGLFTSLHNIVEGIISSLNEDSISSEWEAIGIA